MSNASKYTEKGSVTLRARWEPGKSSGSGRLCLSVTDTGSGIKEENMGLLFEAFSRVDMPSHRYTEGTGLGLAIAKELTEGMGGRIYVESEWGRGSTFGVEIPQTVKDSTPAAIPEQQDAEPPRESSFLAPEGRILAVDDDEGNLQVICSLLGRTMIHVDAASSGDAAIELVGRNKYHAILLDYMMPNLNGVETLHRLRALYLDFSTPVIALTANAVSGTQEMLLREGFSAYMTKPVLWRSLEEQLLAFLPKELVSEASAQPEGPLSAGARKALSDELLAFSIDLDEGLRYLGGDLLQYGKLAGFFSRYSPGSRAKAKKLLEKRDFESLLFELHSLKSRAHAIGAMELCGTATKMELHCRDKDGEFLLRGAPLLMLEWERTDAGALRAAELLSRLESENPASSPSSRSDAERALAEAIRTNSWKAASDISARLISAETNSSLTARLEKIRTAVDELDFEGAAVLMAEYLNETTEVKGSGG